MEPRSIFLRNHTPRRLTNQRYGSTPWLHSAKTNVKSGYGPVSSSSSQPWLLVSPSAPGGTPRNLSPPNLARPNSATSPDPSSPPARFNPSPKSRSNPKPP